MECRLSRIAKPRRHVARVIGKQLDEPVGRLRPADPRELIANHPMFLVQRVEHARHRADCFRRGQQAQRMTRRRGVDDNQVGETRARQTRDLEQSHELVEPGNREIQESLHVLPIEPRPLLENLAERTPMLRQPAGEGTAGVELERVKGAAVLSPVRRLEGPRHFRDAAGQFRPQYVAERVRGIGRDEEHAPAARGFNDRARRRARRLADTAFTAVEEK